METVKHICMVLSPGATNIYHTISVRPVQPFDGIDICADCWMVSHIEHRAIAVRILSNSNGTSTAGLCFVCWNHWYDALSDE